MTMWVPYQNNDVQKYPSSFLYQDQYSVALQLVNLCIQGLSMRTSLIRYKCIELYSEWLLPVHGTT